MAATATDGAAASTAVRAASSFKRWLFLAHRWLGVTLCVFFTLWFVSGMVMLYVGYPNLTERERLTHLPALGTDADLLAPAAALERAGVAGPLRELRLAAARGGRPVYLVKPLGAPATAGGHRHRVRDSGVVVIDAHSGQRLAGADAAVAKASARAFAGDAGAVHDRGTVEEDAHTHTRSLDAHRPLHRMALDDAEGTLLYVSSRTGEVVRDATRTERGWNYVGTWLHWLYALRGNALEPAWSGTVNVLAAVGVFAALAGTVVGVMRWRFARPYRSGSRSPYPGRMMRWHHVAGLLFAASTTTWVFSGWMSMNPWRIFNSAHPPALQMAAVQGDPLQADVSDTLPARLLAAAGDDVRELRWIRAMGRTLVKAVPATGAPLLLDARTAARVTLDEPSLRQAAAGLIAAPVARVERLDGYDLYYYARAAHTMTGGTERPLPILRIAFADPDATWVHVDARTGEVLGRLDRHGRASRWLFALLHSWDWLPLLNRRPLWDGVMLALSLGGLALSATGVVIGWRRLRTKAQARRPAPARGTPRRSLS